MSQVYLLAAGQGRRAGGPKAWMDFHGAPLLQRQVAFLLRRFEPARVTVSIQEGWLSQCRQLHEQVVWVPVDPSLSPLGSLQELLKRSRMIMWSFLYHVDQPVWERGLFEAVSAKIAGTEAEALIPTYGGKRGHPALLSHGLLPHLMDLDPAKDRLDAFLRTRRVEEVPVDFPCVLENWNGGTPQA